MRGSLERARSELAERLHQRRGEIEQAALTRVKAIADPSDAADPGYVEGLRGAVSAAMEHGIAAVGRSGEREPPIPLALLAQARNAARNGVSLDTVLRRYFAGYSLLGYCIIEEAGKDSLLDGVELQRLLASQAALFDRLLAAVGEEHTRETETLRPSSEQRRAERVERLLAGELVDASGLDYEFDGWHLGMVGTGVSVEQVIRRLAAGFDCRLFLLHREEGVLWAWLGARSRFDPANLLRIVPSDAATDSTVAVGEPGEGISGWRLSHRQAAAALPVARRSPHPVVRYADVALLASILQDDLLVTSLRQLYLRPLDDERDGGVALRETLRAYLSAAGSLSSAATTLSVSRRTISNRLLKVEEKLGCPLHTALAEIKTALRIEEFNAVDTISRIEQSGNP